MHMFNVSILYMQSIKLLAVVGVDRPMKAPSMHIQKLISEKLSKFSQLSFCQKLFFLNQTPSCIMFNVFTLYRKSIKLFHQKLP